MDRNKAAGPSSHALQPWVTIPADLSEASKPLHHCFTGYRKDPKNRVERHKAEEQDKEPDHEKAGKVDGTPVGQPVGSEASPCLHLTPVMTT